MPTPTQIRIIARFEDAVREHAFKGSRPPEDHKIITKEYQLALSSLTRAFDKLSAFTADERKLLKDLVYDQIQNPTIMHDQTARTIYDKL